MSDKYQIGKDENGLFNLPEGEWRQVFAKKGRDLVVGVAPSTNDFRWICRMSDNPDQELEEVLINARLIAAAPDMLEILEMLETSQWLPDPFMLRNIAYKGFYTLKKIRG